MLLSVTGLKRRTGFFAVSVSGYSLLHNPPGSSNFELDTRKMPAVLFTAVPPSNHSEPTLKSSTDSDLLGFSLVVHGIQDDRAPPQPVQVLQYPASALGIQAPPVRLVLVLQLEGAIRAHMSN